MLCVAFKECYISKPDEDFRMRPYSDEGPVLCDVDFDVSSIAGKTAVVTGGKIAPLVTTIPVRTDDGIHRCDIDWSSVCASVDKSWVYQPGPKVSRSRGELMKVVGHTSLLATSMKQLGKSSRQALVGEIIFWLISSTSC
jgi:hypothetical protein